MHTSSCLTRRVLLPLGLILGLMPYSMACGQFQQPTTQTQATTVQTVPVQSGFGYNPYINPGWGGYYPGRVGGALNGVAAVTTANGQYQSQIQQARITQQQANQAQLDTRRRMIEDWKYEQSIKITPAEIRQQEVAAALRNARNDPPNTEIWSGVALNALFNNIKRAQLGGLRGPMVPLDPNVLRNINVTSGTTNGSVGMLRDGGKLEWPLILRSAPYRSDKDKIDLLAKQAYEQAVAGMIADDTITGLTEAVDALRSKVDADTPDMTFDQGIKASRFVNEMKGTIRTLQDPNVSRLFNGQWSAQGASVAALVDNLTQKGLFFTAAAPGSETYYTSLYNSLLSYDMALSSLASNSQAQVQTQPR